MNRISTTSHRSFLHAISAATLVAMLAMTGAVWLTVVTPTEPDAGIVRLERVVITGQRSPAADEVAQLPRVVITGKRDAAADGTQLASACRAPEVC